jgi:hypothetical protein
MSGESTVWIGVPCEVAYAAVTDLPRMGEWSPDNCGGEWVHGATAVVGATFLGRNRGPNGEFEQLVTVIEAERPWRFAFSAAAPDVVGTTWYYRFRSERDGTSVTEAFAWYWTPFPDAGFRGRVGKLPIEEAAIAVAQRERHLQDQVDRTLGALKRALES